MTPSRINELIIMDFYGHEHWRNQYVLKKQQLEICQEQMKINEKIIVRMKSEAEDARILQNKMNADNEILHKKVHNRTMIAIVTTSLLIATIGLIL